MEGSGFLGFIHLPGWIDAEWLKQLTAEQLVTVKTRRGFANSSGRSCRSATRRLIAGSCPRRRVITGADRWSDARWENSRGNLRW